MIRGSSFQNKFTFFTEKSKNLIQKACFLKKLKKILSFIISFKKKSHKRCLKRTSIVQL